MKKYLSIFFAFLLLLSLSACALEEEKASEVQNPTVIRTFDKNLDAEGDFGITYYEMSDGTWKTDTYTYKYCLELSGEIPGSDYVWEFTVLSNREDLTFDDAFWASGFSSLSTDYFAPEDAVIVRVVYNTNV